MCLNVMENLMLQQMQQMAANIANTLPQTENSGKNQSFQDMMVQAGKETSSPAWKTGTWSSLAVKS